jgi:hypothetical protein
VFRWFSPDDHRRGAMLPDFFDVFVHAYLSHGETYTDDAVSGAALWAAPHTDPLSAEPVYADRLEEIAGVDAARLFEIVELLEAHSPPERHYHLQFLGVLPSVRAPASEARSWRRFSSAATATACPPTWKQRATATAHCTSATASAPTARFRCPVALRSGACGATRSPS